MRDEKQNIIIFRNNSEWLFKRRLSFHFNFNVFHDIFMKEPLMDPHLQEWRKKKNISLVAVDMWIWKKFVKS